MKSTRSLRVFAHTLLDLLEDEETQAKDEREFCHAQEPRVYESESAGEVNVDGVMFVKEPK